MSPTRFYYPHPTWTLSSQNLKNLIFLIKIQNTDGAGRSVHVITGLRARQMQMCSLKVEYASRDASHKLSPGGN